MAWRSVTAILIGLGALAFTASQASAASIEAGAGVNGGHVSGCVFSEFLLPSVNQTVPGLGVPGAPGTYQNCFPESTNSGIQTNSAASGSVAASFSANANSNGATYSGAAAAAANLATQTVGAKADGATNIIGNIAIGDRSAAFGLIDETITPTSASDPTGRGTIKFQFSVDGSTTVTNSAFSQAQGIQPLLGFAKTQLSLGLSPANISFVGNVVPFQANVALQGNDQPLILPATGSTVTFNATGVTVDTNATVLSAALPITFGQSFDFSFALTAEALPLNESSLSSGSSGDDFLSTGALTGIEVFDANGNPVSDFMINTDAGVELGPNGVIVTTSPVPEPSALLLFASGLSALGLYGRRRGGNKRLAGF